MDPSTDRVVADVRDRRRSIDRRLETIRGRVQRLSPTRYPWQAWTERTWPFAVTLAALWLWRRYRYHHRFMRLP